MSVVNWKILWNEYAFETYLYGSEIIFHKKDDVEFINEMMPPGKIVKRWYSKVNFQAKRVEPSLPMIDGESKYHISVDIESENRRGYIVRIVFYDRYEKEVKSLIVRDNEMDFQCPLKTYSYEVQLINAGAKSFRFHSFTLTEYYDEGE